MTSGLALRRALTAAAIVFVIDQVSKWWAMGLVLPASGGWELMPFVTIVRGWNTGINFGLLQNGAEWFGLALIGFAILVSAVLLWWTKGVASRWHNLASGVVIGGAIGNAVDRLLHGAVFDFINVSCCGIDNPYAFNLADVAVVLGVLVLVWRI